MHTSSTPPFPQQILEMGLPHDAVQNTLKMEGKDVNLINLDPNRSLSKQQSKSEAEKKPAKPKGPKVARKRLNWNKIDESELHKQSFWIQPKEQDLQLVGLDIDNKEFTSLFTSLVDIAAVK